MERLGEGRSGEGSCWLASAFFFCKGRGGQFWFCQGKGVSLVCLWQREWADRKVVCMEDEVVAKGRRKREQTLEGGGDPTWKR